MRICIASGANSAFFPHLQELVQSIRDKPESDAVDLCILDVGLSEKDTRWLGKHVAAIVRPGWDLRRSGDEQAPYGQRHR